MEKGVDPKLVGRGVDLGLVSSGVNLDVWLEVPMLGGSGLVPASRARVVDSRLEGRGLFLSWQGVSRQ